MFSGRKDNQIKHLGHRIELEEIEVAIERQAKVTRCRCVFESQKSRIYAFYEGEAESADLLASIKETLPFFMVPSSITRVQSMPLTKNGKVDRCKMLADYLEQKRLDKEARKARRAAAKKDTHKGNAE